MSGNNHKPKEEEAVVSQKTTVSSNAEVRSLIQSILKIITNLIRD